MTTFDIANRSAIAGYGATEFSKASGKTEMRLAIEATLLALDDAGMPSADVDGICTYTMDSNYEQEVFRNIGGKELKFTSQVGGGGGGACAPFLQAALAVATGIASVVVVYRALNERSGQRFGTPIQGGATASDSLNAYMTSTGCMTPAAAMAIGIRRYMHETGATSEDFANYSIAARRHASTNPHAFFFGKPITREDYLQSRLIADPLRLLDCCQESDGAVAFVVTTPERAEHLKKMPVFIKAAAQGSPRGMLGMWGFHKPDITLRDECAATARQLYSMAKITAKDIQTAIIYDHFGPTVLPALEAYGFCAPGEAKDFVKDHNIEVGGGLPVNTHGGLIGEAYIHGLNGVAEAVRQLRGEAVNQVGQVENVLVTGASAVPTSGLILSVRP